MDTRLEIWGGVECTVNRIGAVYYDQLERSGHARRMDDLDRIAELGVRTLRYPVLWERIAPKGLRQADWSWTDERLHRLRELGIEPIVGLVHHGSGPRYTDLLDEHFPSKLAEFAGAVARRYPWLRMFTPVNEPLTTARFSALYGLWYPHGRSDESFLRAVINQCAGVRAAMSAIRVHIPHAQLVQTEDTGKTHSTERLRYQADFDNARRWLTLDMLSGRIERNRIMRGYLNEHGFAAQLASFSAAPCPPDVIGLNYYVTSERFIDERIERYPAATHGGNALERYADVAAVRVCHDAPQGPASCAAELWERYRRPIAITEVHLGCTPEEQLRWLSDVHTAAQDARRSGVDLRAITAWALFGSFNWNSLLTKDDGFYEAGAFDVRSDPPRATALAHAIRRLVRAERWDHPVLDAPGWWRRILRFEAEPHRIQPVSPAVAAHSLRPRPIVVVNCPRPLIKRTRAICHIRGIACLFVNASRTNGAPFFELQNRLVARQRAWATLNFSIVDEPEVHYACVQAGTAYGRVAELRSDRLDDSINTTLDRLVHYEHGASKIA